MKTPEISIIEKTLNNEATPEQAREVAQWFSTPEGQNWLSERMDADRNRIRQGSEEEYIDHPVASERMLKRINNRIHQHKRRTFLFRAAAVILPVLLIAGIYLELNARVDLFATSEYEEVYVPKGEQMQFVFQDGSRVLLNSESILRYPKRFGFKERKVYLQGEGWFEVAQKKERPFIVEMQDFRLMVLGTTFNAKAYEEDAEIMVALSNGSVELSGVTFQTFQIVPGEKVLYNKGTGKCRIVRPKDIKTSFSWKDNVFDFVDAPLTEVLNTLNRSFDTTFEVVEKAALNYQYTLRTEAVNLTHVLRELETIAPVRFEQKDDKVLITVKR
ncbi:FecR domain-containing protein [Parabacteroides sp. OttesenSCG-928-K15]|nr:FecR domain-containing protein [Parabacteroides sp. OttesenSCG-928-K15]